MPKELFDIKYESVFGPGAEWTDKANTISYELNKAIRAVFEAYPEVNPRELHYLVCGSSMVQHLRVLAISRRINQEIKSANR